MVFFSKEQSLYDYVVKDSPKLKGRIEFMCSIDAQRYEKYNKDKMQVFLSSTIFVILKKYLEEGIDDVSQTNNCRETFFLWFFL